MPHFARIPMLVLTIACGVFAAESVVPSGDAVSWTSVGGILTAIGVVCAKVIARTQRR